MASVTEGAESVGKAAECSTTPGGEGGNAAAEPSRVAMQLDGSQPVQPEPEASMVSDTVNAPETETETQPQSAPDNDDNYSVELDVRE